MPSTQIPKSASDIVVEKKKKTSAFTTTPTSLNGPRSSYLNDHRPPFLRKQPSRRPAKSVATSPYM
jgi:hypothetical protein